MNAQQYLATFLQWERTHPNEPFRDWAGLVAAIATALSDEAQMRAVVGAAVQSDERLRGLLQQMLNIAENCDETGYIDGVGFVDLDKLHEKVRAALAP